ncbi:MAG: hypothetical protein KC505_04575 [Myxococcales bacterium]|nr:hypothetical protein [Myxococcales bacterium]USN50992.1 MAG: hypothetical protein H6731_00835 [Myxococcales bacterium]
MKLCQKVTLDKRHMLNMSLVVQDDAAASWLTKAHELSFYPFSLRAHSDLELEGVSKACKLELTIIISDNEQNKPIFKGLSSTSSLLLVAEIIQGLTECIEVFGFKLEQIQAQEIFLKISLSSEARPKGEVLGALMLLKTSINALLFVRGLELRHAKLVQSSFEQESTNIIEKIFYERADVAL